MARSRTIAVKGEKISYRRANINDAETLVNYRVRFLNELSKPSDDEEARVLKKSLSEYFSKAIPSHDFIAWIALRDGVIVGTSGMVVWRLPARHGGLESGRAGYILNMYTVPEARGKGICTRLLEELISEARSIGLKYLHLHTSKHGMRIYRRRGFVEPEDPELKLSIE